MYLSEIYEWQLIQDLGLVLRGRKARHIQQNVRASPQINECFELELRLVLAHEKPERSLTELVFEDCQQRLSKICELLDRLVDPAFNGYVQFESDRIYPHLQGLVGYLKNHLRKEHDPEEQVEQYDLVNGSHRTLFKLPRDTSKLETGLELMKDFNAFMQKLVPAPQQFHRKSPARQKKRPWEKSTLRDHVKTAFNILFRRFSCSFRHEVMLRLTEDYQPSLHLLLSPCPESGRPWQEAFYGSYTHRDPVNVISNMCSNLQANESPNKLLHLLDEEDELLGAWIENSSPQVDSRLSLDDLIGMDVFKRVYHKAIFNQGPDLRFTRMQKRHLAVKLGYCLMNFFDSEFSSKQIHFLIHSKNPIQEAMPWLSFSSSLSTTPESGFSQVVNPVLLSFAKVLIDIELGESIKVEINPSLYTSGDQKRLSECFAALLGYVSQLEEDGDNSYLEAIRGCLSAPKEIKKALKIHGIRGQAADVKIREEIYNKIVKHLEDELGKCTPRARNKRVRSESPPGDDSNHILLSNAEEHDATGMYSSYDQELPKSSWKRQRNLDPNTGRMPEREFNQQLQLRSSARQSLRNNVQGVDSLQQDIPYFSQQVGLTRSSTSLSMESMLPHSRDEFQIAILCALNREFNAIKASFDECIEGSSYGKVSRDPNIYTIGKIGQHFVVLAQLAGMGKAQAASQSAYFSASFINIKLGLLVGVCAGAPKTPKGEEILLGDVIISTYIFQHDFGRQNSSDKLTPKKTVMEVLGRPSPNIRVFLDHIKTLANNKLQEETCTHLKCLLQHDLIRDKQDEWQYPGAEKDELYDPNNPHKHRSDCDICKEASDWGCDLAQTLSCAELGCGQHGLVERLRLERIKKRDSSSPKPVIHLGAIASGDTVVKNSSHRDRLAREHKVIAFEMEGVGVWENLPTIIIKGVCDYGDSHKNKLWQNYAAANAASCMKAVLNRAVEFLQG